MGRATPCVPRRALLVLIHPGDPMPADEAPASGPGSRREAVSHRDPAKGRAPPLTFVGGPAFPAARQWRMSSPRPQLLDRQPAGRVRIGDCVVEILSREVVRNRDGQRSRVTFKALGVLFALIAQEGEVVGRETLLQWVWPNTMPTEDVLNQAVTQLRKAFGDDADQPRYIRTIARTGYRLLAGVEWLAPPEAASADVRDAHAAASASAPLPQRGQGRDGDRWTRGPLLVVAVLLAGTVGLTVANVGGLAGSDRDEAFPALQSFQRITSRPGVESMPTLSPDGAQVAYTSFSADGDGALMLQATAQAPPRALTRPGVGERDVMPAWSPDGRWIAFARDDLRRARCRVMLLPVSGGAERVVGDCLHDDTSALAWHPDGTRLIADGVSKQPGRHGAIETLDLGSGRWTPVAYARRIDDVDMVARYSPDGRWIAFLRNVSLSDVWLMPASGGTPRRLTRLGSPMTGLAWTRDSGALVFSAFQSGTWRLFTVGIDGGEARPIGPAGARHPATALRAEGIAFAMDDSVHQLHLLDASRPDAAPTPLFPSSASDMLPSLAPDGRQLVFVSYRSGRIGLWWGRVDDPASLRWIEGVVPVPRHAASWSGDGRSVLLVGERGGRSVLEEVDVGSGRATQLAVPEGEPVQAAYLPEGRLLVVVKLGDGHQRLDRYDRRHAPWRREASIGNVAFVRADPAGDRILFTRPLEWGVWQANPGLGRISKLGDRPDFDGGRRIAFIAGRAVLGESGEGCGLRWRALDAAASTPQVACLTTGAALNDFSVAVDGGRVLFSSTRREQDIAVAALRPSR